MFSDTSAAVSPVGTAVKIASTNGVALAVTSGLSNFTAGGASTKVGTFNLTAPTVPKESECVSTLGALATNGKGFIGIIDHNNAQSNVHICVIDNASSAYWFVPLTKCVG